ncbi:hypothetical protein XENORESO_003219 [Xenotaenia resolanae]|uniref:Uncharacterized protein n=1 Tax=Xenotaenia resolanae TaxID=208358 RepID=A0ABV0X7Z0_9TELE
MVCSSILTFVLPWLITSDDDLDHLHQHGLNRVLESYCKYFFYNSQPKTTITLPFISKGLHDLGRSAIKFSASVLENPRFDGSDPQILTCSVFYSWFHLFGMSSSVVLSTFTAL